MKKLFIFIPILMAFVITNAQNYNVAVGLRGGPSAGLTYKQFLGKSPAIEGIVASRWGGLNIVGLYELHNKVFKQRRGGTGGFDSNGLEWYYGAGGHIGFWKGSAVNPWYNDNVSHTVIGVDGIIGIEYTLRQFPLNFSLDYKPAFNLIGYNGFWGDEGALSIRYTF